jgi:hypothetical protein
LRITLGLGDPAHDGQHQAADIGRGIAPAFAETDEPAAALFVSSSALTLTLPSKGAKPLHHPCEKATNCAPQFGQTISHRGLPMTAEETAINRIALSSKSSGHHPPTSGSATLTLTFRCSGTSSIKTIGDAVMAAF